MLRPAVGDKVCGWFDSIIPHQTVRNFAISLT